jgi:hypothetical protein
MGQISIKAISFENFECAAIVIGSTGNRYLVTASLPEKYQSDNSIIHYTFECNCKGHKFNNAWCKHIDLVAMVMTDNYDVLPF